MTRFDFRTNDNATPPHVLVYREYDEGRGFDPVAVFYILPAIGMVVDECEQRALSLVADLEQTR